MLGILAHKWKEGILYFEVEWFSKETTWESFMVIQEDYPVMTSECMIANNTSRKSGHDPNMTWAHKVARNIKQTICCLQCKYEFYINKRTDWPKLRHITKDKKKKGKYSKGSMFKYGIQVPQNMEEALELDWQNKNTFWQDSVTKEMRVLDDMEYFKYKPQFWGRRNRKHAIVHVTVDSSILLPTVVS